MSTATTTESTASPPPWVPSPLYRLTLEKYESLIASGFLSKRDDVHLINGYLVNRMPESPLRGAIREAVRLAIEALLPAAWHTRGGKGLRIPSQVSLPRPDLAVVRGVPRDYIARYPEPADTALVVEVSYTSLNEDRALADIYGAGGVPVYWIINLVDGQIEVYCHPGPHGYQTHEVLAPGHVLHVALGGVEIGAIEGPTSCPDGAESPMLTPVPKPLPVGTGC
ncbi:MAG: Uma2 family endonuclease [Isosphaeraceae bacterium]